MAHWAGLSEAFSHPQDRSSSTVASRCPDGGSRVCRPLFPSASSWAQRGLRWRVPEGYVSSHAATELDPHKSVTSKDLTTTPHGPSEPPLWSCHSFSMLQRKAAEPRGKSAHPPPSLWSVAPGPGWVQDHGCLERECSAPGSQGRREGQGLCRGTEGQLALGYKGHPPSLGRAVGGGLIRPQAGRDAVQASVRAQLCC